MQELLYCLLHRITLLFALTIRFKKELVFHCRTFNDIFDYDDIGTR